MEDAIVRSDALQTFIWNYFIRSQGSIQAHTLTTPFYKVAIELEFSFRYVVRQDEATNTLLNMYAALISAMEAFSFMLLN